MKHWVAGAAVIAMSLAACGDAEPRCAVDRVVRDQRSALCLGAHELAKRSTDAIVPSQTELEEAEVLIERAFQALRPGFARIPVAASWDQARAEVTLRVAIPAVMEAWGRHELETGVAPIDDVVAQMNVTTFTYDGSLALPSATLVSSHAVSAPNVARSLESVDGISVELVDTRGFLQPSDVIDEGVGRVVFTVGWGDCAVGCAQAHFWRTVVAEDGRATLVEEWGDPVPPAIVESYATPAPYL